MIFETKQTEKAAPLFGDWQETLIWSCLQKVMGTLYVDSLDTPASAMILLGDFCFLAGRPDPQFAEYQPWRDRTNPNRSGIILVPQNEKWGALIEEYYKEQAEKVTRYAIKKEPGIFDREHLQAVVDTLPAGYTLKMMDEELFWKCRQLEWCRDWVWQYPDYALYEKYGLGAVVLKDGEPVSGASSYSGYIGGIEVEIVTRQEHRRKGLAYVCGAKLILECIKRGWYPSWDAQNPWSAALAEKLGYHFDHEYTAYVVSRMGKESNDPKRSV